MNPVRAAVLVLLAATAFASAGSDASGQQIPEPEFTPMTVRPALTNADEVRQAVMREYPVVLRHAGVEGTPQVWIHVDQAGAVDATRLYRSSGHTGLDEAGMNVARVMRFSPAENEGAVVAVWVQIPIRFVVVR